MYKWIYIIFYKGIPVDKPFLLRASTMNDIEVRISNKILYGDERSRAEIKADYEIKTYSLVKED